MMFKASSNGTMASSTVTAMALLVCFSHQEHLSNVEAFAANTFVRRTTRPRTRPTTLSPLTTRPVLWSFKRVCLSTTKNPNLEDGVDLDDGDSTEWIDSNAELITDDFYDDEQNDEWMPDREKARRAREARTRQGRVDGVYNDESDSKPQTSRSVTSVEEEQYTKNKAYTEEEEELIAAMGGKNRQSSSRKREDGFLGDSTLKEIAMDYSVPVCYLADVLCMWGVPVPIDVNDRLADLVTGEQAFAIVEAIYSLDVAALHDRYSNQSMISLCDDYSIDLKEGFQMAMKEGWSLPFGVQTYLRVEQEEELIRVLGAI